MDEVADADGTLTKTFDISRLVRISTKKKLKLNMLICYCIGRAASGIREFYLLPKKDKMLQYDAMAVNVFIIKKIIGHKTWGRNLPFPAL